MTRIAEKRQKTVKPGKTGEVSGRSCKETGSRIHLRMPIIEKNRQKKPAAKRTEERSPLLDCLKKKDAEEKKEFTST